MSIRYVHSPYSFAGMVTVPTPSAVQQPSSGHAPATPPPLTATSDLRWPSAIRPSLPAGFPAPLPPPPCPAPQPSLAIRMPPSVSAALSLEPVAQAQPYPAPASLSLPHSQSHAPGRANGHGGSP
eukprot:RCo027045